MNGVMAVRCPACDDRIEGASSEDLSRSIKTHFSESHYMDIEVEMNTSDEGCGCGSPGGENSSSSEDREKITGGAEARKEGSEEPIGSPIVGMGLAPGGEVDYKEKSFEVSDTRSMTEMGKFEAGIEMPGGTGGAEETRGVHGFECPVCRREMGGSDENERTVNFREHLTSDHKDEPFITQLMEKVGAR